MGDLHRQHWFGAHGVGPVWGPRTWEGWLVTTGVASALALMVLLYLAG